MEIRNVQLPPSSVPVDLGRRGQAKAARQGAGGDPVEISSAARRAALVDRLVQQTLALPESRPAVVEAARLALQAGDLDTQAALHATARALAQGG